MCSIVFLRTEGENNVDLFFCSEVRDPSIERTDDNQDEAPNGNLLFQTETINNLEMRYPDLRNALNGVF